MAWPAKQNLAKYVRDQLKGHFIGFIVGTSAASFVSTFFETRKVSNFWGLTARKTVVSADTFRFLEWFCALVVGFIVFELVNSLVREKFSTQLKKISSFFRDHGPINASAHNLPFPPATQDRRDQSTREQIPGRRLRD